MSKTTDPIDMLKEIEAYLTFRLLGDAPTVPVDDMRHMKGDINICLKANGHETQYRPKGAGR